MVTELLIANGRLGEDAHEGNYTFNGDNGRSVVDYLLLSHNDFDTISNGYILFRHSNSNSNSTRESMVGV